MQKVEEPSARLNRYTCSKCGGAFVTVDGAVGVTPFMVGCRTTPGCEGNCYSSMYKSVEGAPSFVWLKPPQGEYQRLSPAAREHVDKGGLHLYPIEYRDDVERGKTINPPPLVRAPPDRKPLSNTCGLPTCGRNISRNYFMCGEHADLVPPDLFARFVRAAEELVALPERIGMSDVEAAARSLAKQRFVDVRREAITTAIERHNSRRKEIRNADSHASVDRVD